MSYYPFQKTSGATRNPEFLRPRLDQTGVPGSGGGASKNNFGSGSSRVGPGRVIFTGLLNTSFQEFRVKLEIH